MRRALSISLCMLSILSFANAKKMLDELPKVKIGGKEYTPSLDYLSYKGFKDSSKADVCVKVENVPSDVCKQAESKDPVHVKCVLNSDGKTGTVYYLVFADMGDVYYANKIASKSLPYLEKIKEAILKYMNDKKVFPSSLDDLVNSGYLDKSVLDALNKDNISITFEKITEIGDKDKTDLVLKIDGLPDSVKEALSKNEAFYLSSDGNLYYKIAVDTVNPIVADYGQKIVSVMQKIKDFQDKYKIFPISLKYAGVEDASNMVIDDNRADFGSTSYYDVVLDVTLPSDVSSEAVKELADYLKGQGYDVRYSTGSTNHIYVLIEKDPLINSLFNYSYKLINGEINPLPPFVSISEEDANLDLDALAKYFNDASILEYKGKLKDKVIRAEKADNLSRTWEKALSGFTDTGDSYEYRVKNYYFNDNSDKSTISGTYSGVELSTVKYSDGTEEKDNILYIGSGRYVEYKTNLPKGNYKVYVRMYGVDSLNWGGLYGYDKAIISYSNYPNAYNTLKEITPVILFEDLVSHNQNNALAAFILHDADGIVGKALDVSDYNQGYIDYSCTYSKIKNYESVTYTFWLYVYGNIGTWQSLFHLDPANNNDFSSYFTREPACWLYYNDNRFFHYRNDSDIKNDGISKSSGGITYNTWHFLAFVRTPTSLKIYVDGKLTDTYSPASGTFKYYDGYLYLGDPWYKKYWKMDNFRIFNKELSSEEINQVMQDDKNGVVDILGDGSCVLFYDFDHKNVNFIPITLLSSYSKWGGSTSENDKILNQKLNVNDNILSLKIIDGSNQGWGDEGWAVGKVLILPSLD